MNDFALDAAFDEFATEDPEHRTRGLHESPSRYLARTSKRRAAIDPGAPTRPISSRADDHDAPDGELSSSPSGRVAPLQNEGHAPGMARDL
jgi:hypothetical protein